MHLASGPAVGFAWRSANNRRHPASNFNVTEAKKCVTPLPCIMFGSRYTSPPNTSVKDAKSVHYLQSRKWSWKVIKQWNFCFLQNRSDVYFCLYCHRLLRYAFNCGCFFSRSKLQRRRLYIASPYSVPARYHIFQFPLSSSKIDKQWCLLLSHWGPLWRQKHINQVSLPTVFCCPSVLLGHSKMHCTWSKWVLFLNAVVIQSV